MKLSLVLIVYRSDSSIALEASKFCEEVLKAKNIKSNRIESDFHKEEIEKYLCQSESQPDIGIVLGGDGTFLKCANALADYDIPLLSINIGGNLGFLTQEKDFLFTDAEERRKLLKETRNLGLILANKFVKYTKSASKGKLLFRKTIRKSLKNGGNLYDIVLKPKIKKKPRLILLCDISGSMALYSLFGLTLLFGVVQRFRSVHAFVFIDGITDITKELKNLKFNNINKILTNWNNYVHVDGHSDYEKSFKDLLDEKTISNSSFNTLIVIGDARNNYRPINTETIDKLSKKFQNIYWMNPERSQYWNTGDSQFHHYQSISKKYSEVRNFEQLKTFINSINFKRVIK